MVVLTMLTARLRPIGWALLRAPVYLGTLTIRSAGPGPGARAARQTGQNQENSPKKRTQKSFLKTAPGAGSGRSVRSSSRGARVGNAQRFPCGGICCGRVEPKEVG